MDKPVLKDDMKKESNVCLAPIILFFAFALIVPIVIKFIYQGDGFSDKDILLSSVLFILLGCYFLYLYLYAVTYSLTVTTDKIKLKTLFRKTDLNLSDIKQYQYKRYRKSVFYQFTFFYADKKIVINTRYQDALVRILEHSLKQD